MGGIPGTRLSLFLLHFCIRWPGEAARPTDHFSSFVPRDKTDVSRELQIVRDCTLIEKCDMCTFSDQKNIDACQATGRREKIACTEFDGDDSKITTAYYSCKYTDADDQFAMVRMQMICAMLGLMAFGSVQRQKRSTASLFEQRKAAVDEARMHSREKRGHNNGMDEDQVELITVQQQERTPLISCNSNVLEIV